MVKFNYNKKKFNTIKGCSNPNTIQISEDRKSLAYINKSKKNKILEIDNPNKTIQLGLANETLIMFQFSSNDSNKLYILYLSGTIRIWNITTQSSLLIQISFEFKAYKQFYFSCNLKYLRCQNEKNKIDVWEIETSKMYFEISVHDIQETAFSKNEEQFTLAIIQEDFQSQINRLNVKFKKQHISFTNNDQELICFSQNSIFLWKINESLQVSLIGYWQLSLQIEQFQYDFKNQTIIAFNSFSWKIVEWSVYESQELKVCLLSHDSKYFIYLSPYLEIYELYNLKMLIENKNFEGQFIQFQQNEILVIAKNQELQYITEINKIVEIKKQTIKIKYLTLLQIKIIHQYNSKIIIRKMRIKTYQLKHIQMKILFWPYFIVMEGHILMRMGILHQKDQIGFKSYKFKIYKNQSQNKLYFQIRNVITGRYFIILMENQYSYLQIESISIVDSHTLKIIKQQEIDFEVKEVQISMNWKYFALMGSKFVKIFLYQNQEQIILQQTINENDNTINCTKRRFSLDWLAKSRRFHKFDFLMEIGRRERVMYK